MTLGWIRGALLLLVFAGGVARAAGPERVTYHFADSALEFVRIPKQALTVSAGCIDKPGPAKCEALRAAERASLHGQRLARGAQYEGPRSEEVLCMRTGGRVVKGTLEGVGDNAFCLYRDRSALDLGSLMSWAERNDSLVGAGSVAGGAAAGAGSAAGATARSAAAGGAGVR